MSALEQVQQFLQFEPCALFQRIVSGVVSQTFGERSAEGGQAARRREADFPAAAHRLRAGLRRRLGRRARGETCGAALVRKTGQPMKTVQVIGHSFDGAPAHLTVEGRGSGQSLKSAARKAVGAMLADRRLRWKHIDSFKLTAVVIANGKSPK